MSDYNNIATTQATTQAATTATTAANVSKPANTDEYNGWKNYETWCVHLWLSNDAYTDTTAREIVAAAWTNAADEVAADREAIVAPHADAADALRDWLRDEENPLSETANLYTDLLGHALARVDWYELAEAFQPDPLPSIEPAPEDDQEGDERQEGPEPEWWRTERERED